MKYLINKKRHYYISFNKLKSVQKIIYNKRAPTRDVTLMSRIINYISNNDKIIYLSYLMHFIIIYLLH